MRVAQKGIWLSTAVIAIVVGPVAANTTEATYDFLGLSVDSGDMESTFGPKVAELDARAEGFDFGSGTDPYRNLNLISQVHQVETGLALGTGDGGSEIALSPGDHVFAYTLDYTDSQTGTGEAAIKDFQLLRAVINKVFADVENAGAMIAFDQIAAGAYNTNTEFATPALDAFPEGLTGEETNALPGENFFLGDAEYGWPSGGPMVMPGNKAMVMLFTTPDVTIYAADGNGEGANIIGGGSSLDEIPALVPIPEPMTTAALMVGGFGLVAARRRRRP